MSLEKLGWNTYFQKKIEPYLDKGFCAARVINQHKGKYIVCSENGSFNGKLSGKFMYNADLKKDYPAVGDWVAIKMVNDTEAIIYVVLPRKSYFARKLAISGGRKMKNGILVGGNIEEQIIGSNIDTAFIVSGLDDNFNIGRIERYITLVRSSGATPVILLNKCDLCNNVSDYIEKIDIIAKGIAVYSISVLNNINMDIFDKFLCCNETIVFLGSSGVGKSTVINYLLGGEILKTNTISSSNGKGRHTTTGSQLLHHSSGCTIIDTPGTRELQLWADEDILSESFQDIYSLTDQCRYRDCAHEKEDGCAIKAALEDGKLTIERFNSYKSQLNELNTLKDTRKCYDNSRKNKLNKVNKKRGYVEC
ncbi:ribosome small subunit-dependent GTPase A [Clostridium estertheticum]|uniref:ribosome small subunit-dependent GTPase A n=1 Tax=Clostridium estertheticum TaxID=238834 RepID=UPI0013E954E5|nr:ribosome small subunit-dependent GTPase A [Clostridium estertheticum]MBZ9687302.1 ribosome small subunit-dependent GTPase A [Clostridium estertheticum]